MKELTKNQQMELITGNIAAVHSRFSEVLKDEFSPETKNYFKGTSLAELQGIMSTIHYIFGRDCSAYIAAQASWQEINATNCY